MIADDDPFDVHKLALSDDQVRERLASVPHRMRKRRQHFIKVPWVWAERLAHAPAHCHLSGSAACALPTLERRWRAFHAFEHCDGRRRGNPLAQVGSAEGVGTAGPDHCRAAFAARSAGHRCDPRMSVCRTCCCSPGAA
jgi:hypothetical protein